MTMDILTLS